MANTQNMANAIRALAMDAVQQANSGHPGAPMGMADMAVALWSRHLQHNPVNPHWANRDRFILSNGHGSMLIYALLHLSGYDLPIEELKNFRQLHSKTAGHPEVGITVGVETTTGPLGQGITNAVGFALAEKLLAAEFNKDKHEIVDHHTYVFLGDGCLMEGISHEAAALAGAWKLNKLIALYDDNGISIDGKVTPWFIDNTPERFEAYGWNVIRAVDGHNVDALDKAIAAAKKSADKPTLICCKTVIGKGSPNKAGTHDVHGAPLGKDEVAATRAALGITSGPFEIAADVYAGWDARANGAARQAEWQKLFDAYRAAHPELAAEFLRRMAGEAHPEFAAKADAALAELRALAEADLGDFVVFEFVGAVPIKVEDEYRSGLKVAFVPLLGGKRLQEVSIDLVADRVACGEPEIVTPADRIDVAGVPMFDYRVYPLANSLADKLCAMVETHDGKPSSRIKDLVDVAIYATTVDIDGGELCRRVRSEAGFSWRTTA